MTVLTCFLIGLPGTLLCLSIYGCARDLKRERGLTKRQRKRILAHIERDLNGRQLHDAVN